LARAKLDMKRTRNRLAKTNSVDGKTTPSGIREEVPITSDA